MTSVFDLNVPSACFLSYVILRVETRKNQGGHEAPEAKLWTVI